MTQYERDTFVETVIPQCDDAAAEGNWELLLEMGVDLEQKAEQNVCDMTFIMAAYCIARFDGCRYRLDGDISTAIEYERYADKLEGCISAGDDASARAYLNDMNAQGLCTIGRRHFEEE
jgi:hypothetical protein